MEDDFKIVVFTPEKKVSNEAEKIVRLLSAGAWRVSIRKPAEDKAYIEKLLKKIPTILHHRITLHDYPELCEKYDVGYQLNSRISGDIPKCKVLSRSCHSLEELNEIDVDYATISPIFDSISKKGYKANPQIANFNPKDYNCRLIALGGITLDNIKVVKKAGFSGAAMLGSVWEDDEHFEQTLKWLRMRNVGFQFIADGDDVEKVISQCQSVIEGGCRWIQIRMKHSALTDILKVADGVNKLMMPSGGTLIVDDHVELIGINGISGVHLGQMDMDVNKARQIAGNSAIIGLTINNKEHLENAVDVDADYFGIGPYRYTSTKKILSDILGIEGYKELDTHRNRLGITTPYVAIGGITPDDIQELKTTDAIGIAVSGAISKHTDPIAQTKLFAEKLQANDM